MPLLEVKIPPMGESISSGILAKWHVKDGDIVKKDQPLFELETDKITSEGLAESAGKISLKVAVGDEVKIGQVVATIDSAATGIAAPSPRSEAAPASRGDSGTATSTIGNPYAPPGSKQAAEAVAQSPAVRRLAGETGIDPTAVAGSGKGGRVTKGDMLAATEAKAATPAPTKSATASFPSPTPSPVAATAASSPTTRQTRRKMSPLRAKIAQRLVAAQHEAAMLTTFNE